MLKLYKKYMGNAGDRTSTAETTAFAITTFTASVQLIMGIILISPWYIINSVYNLILSTARGQALKRYKTVVTITDNKKRYSNELAVYKRSGILVCLLGVSYFFICLWMFSTNESHVQKDMAPVLGVATVSFVKIGFSIHGMIVNRHMHNPIVSLFKTISFLDALVSIVITQCSLLTMLEEEAAVSSSALFGMGVSGLFLIIGIMMLARKKQQPVIKTKGSYINPT